MYIYIYKYINIYIYILLLANPAPSGTLQASPASRRNNPRPRHLPPPTCVHAQSKLAMVYRWGRGLLARYRNLASKPCLSPQPYSVWIHEVTSPSTLLEYIFDKS